MPNANEAGEVFVEDLEAAAVLFGLTGVAEAAWAVEDACEGVEVDWVAISARLDKLWLMSILRASCDVFGSMNLGRLTVSAHLSFQVSNLRQRRVLPTCS